MTEILAGDVSSDDRRRVVNAGLRTGRDAVIAEISGFAEIGVTAVASDIIATRGRHLSLSRIRSFVGSQPVDAFQAEAIHVIEIDADERISAIVVFDVEDIEAAFQELDARYLAGEAAAHARTWSVICWQLRGDQPTRDAFDHAGLCQHRPPPGDRDGGRRPDRIYQRRAGPGPRQRLMSRPCIG